MDLPLPLRPPPSPFGLVSVCGLLTELEDVGRVVALAGYGHEARRLPFLCTSLARDDELLVATRTAVYGGLGRTRLMYAARAGDVGRVQALLRPRGAEDEVDAEDAEGRTALHHACAAGRAEVVRLLLDKGADKDKEDECLWRPLHFASAMGHLGVVRLLLQRGAALEPFDVGDWDPSEQPLHLACEHGHVEVVRLLLDAGADEDAMDDRIRTPYIRAVERGQAAVVNLLLDRGQQVDGRTADGSSPYTALAAAATRKQEAMAWLLLERGADVNARNDNSWTALHVAAAGPGSASLTRLFLSLGADPEAINDLNKTPYSEALTSYRHEKVQKLVDPLRVQEFADVVAIYEALEEDEEVEGGR
jgi:ankyrin repeat protein